MTGVSLTVVLLAAAAAPVREGPPVVWHQRAGGVVPVSRLAVASLSPLVKAVKAAVVHVRIGQTGAVGSGFLLDSAGWVLTNAHVVGIAKAVALRLADGQVLIADVVGKDDATDLALLRIQKPPARLPFAFLGDSDALEIGDWVVAIGNPFGLAQSVSHGVVSAKERILGLSAFDDFLQTDVFMNPGSSGGPLFNLRGEVVGVTTARVSEGQGIGFAVPINLAKALLPQLILQGKVLRGWLGLTVEEATGGTRGTVVKVVAEGGPAQAAGLVPGDRILAVDGKPVESYLWMLRRVVSSPPGTVLTLKVDRAGKARELQLPVAQPPSAPKPSAPRP